MVKMMYNDDKVTSGVDTASASEQEARAVLIVEDESLIRMEAVDMVEEAGFTVYEAGNASEALRLLEMHDDIGVLFTDIDMPGSMNGLELANMVRTRWPHIGLLITSGHVRITLKDIPEKGLFFPKPYQANEVTKTLQKIQTVSPAPTDKD